MPVLLGVSFCVSFNASVGLFNFGLGSEPMGFGTASTEANAQLNDGASWLLAICMIITCILMQSAVNVLNDYMDFKRGADTQDNQLDPTDAVLIYNNVNLNHVLIYFFALMMCALALGLYLVFASNLTTLIIGLVGAAILVLYSAGKTPLSYLPLGEAASGIVMGALIMVATCNVLTGFVSTVCAICSLPVVLTIGLINFTNNTCDIEKDIEAKRRTLSVHLGRQRARKVYKAIMICAVVCVVVFTGLFFTRGLYVCVVMVVALIPTFKALANNPFVLESRGPAMGAAVTFNVELNCFYALAMCVSALPAFS